MAKKIDGSELNRIKYNIKWLKILQKITIGYFSRFLAFDRDLFIFERCQLLKMAKIANRK